MKQVKRTYISPSLEIKNMKLTGATLYTVSGEADGSDREILDSRQRSTGSGLDFSGCGSSDNYSVDWDF